MIIFSLKEIMPDDVTQSTYGKSRRKAPWLPKNNPGMGMMEVYTHTQCVPKTLLPPAPSQR